MRELNQRSRNMLLGSVLLTALSGCSQVGIGSKPLGGSGEALLMGTVRSSDIRIEPLSGSSQTTSLVAFDNVLGNMSSVLGVKPSAATVTTYQQARTSYALNGSATEINASMMMAVSTLAGRICDDLYSQEKARSAESRTYYKDATLTGVSNLGLMLNGKSLEDRIIDRMTIGAWGRAATNDERAEFKGALDSISPVRTALNEQNTREALLVTCTLALSSLQALEL